MYRNKFTYADDTCICMYINQYACVRVCMGLYVCIDRYVIFYVCIRFCVYVCLPLFFSLSRRLSSVFLSHTLSVSLPLFAFLYLSLYLLLNRNISLPPLSISLCTYCSDSPFLYLCLCLYLPLAGYISSCVSICLTVGLSA